MSRYKKQSFKNADIELDENEFVGCKFEGCTLIYHGGKPPRINGCSFSSDIRISFEGAAGDTVALMTALYHCGLQPIIEDTINNIRGNTNPMRGGVTLN